MTTELLGYGIGVVVVWLVAMRLRSVTARQSLYLVASWLFYLSWGSWLIVVLLFSSLMNYALGRVAEKADYRGAAVDWNHSQSGAAKRFQIPALARDRRTVRFAAFAAQTNCFPLRNFVLDVPGAELSVGAVSRRRAESDAAGVLPVHGVLADGAAGADLPDVEHAAAIPPGLVGEPKTI